MRAVEAVTVAMEAQPVMVLAALVAQALPCCAVTTPP
jgi:hypothetical protein